MCQLLANLKDRSLCKNRSPYGKDCPSYSPPPQKNAKNNVSYALENV